MILDNRLVLSVSGMSTKELRDLKTHYLSHGHIFNTNFAVKMTVARSFGQIALSDRHMQWHSHLIKYL